jgi:hypothetical protein
MNEIDVVFIHLGEARADHLWLNISRHFDLFPSVPVTVIIDSNKHRTSIDQRATIFFYQRESTRQGMPDIEKQDMSFRQGFWRYSLERLFAITSFHASFPEKKLLHLESDVILFPNFPWKGLQKQEKLMWNRYNAERDIAALLFIPNLIVSQWLTAELTNLLNENSSYTDMTALSCLARRHPNDVQIFPALSKVVPKLANSVWHGDPKLSDALFNRTVLDDGVFDGAQIGMWLTGQDPRNHYGIIKLHGSGPSISGDSMIDPSAVDYTFSLDGCLKLINKESLESIDVWALHIHSKNLQLFSKAWIKELDRYVELSKNKEPISFFDGRVLLRMAIESIRNMSFLKFILGFPYVYRSRRWLSPRIKRLPWIT